ncbi:phage protein [Viridibacillus sp. NPDC096237]|uniref:phage protein n=1 Tax=Viridibacillus sp. NPDC096237 TaxID=3390721 RepID=UPI003D02EAE0
MAKRLFRRVIKVTIEDSRSRLKFDGDELEIRFVVNFDDDSKPNINTISIFNLTEATIAKIKKGANVTLNAGYESDYGVLIEGKITKVITRYEGVDKITTVTFKEGKDYSGVKVTPQLADAAKKYFVKKRVKLKKPVTTTTVGKNGRKYTSTKKFKTVQVAKWRKQTMNITFAKNTKGSAIINRLLGILGIKPVEINLPKDKVYKNGFKVTGKIESKLNTVIKDCGASMYWRRGKVVIRSIEIGDDERFELNESTGLIETPAEYEDDDFEGYTIRCLLQHRITTASIITLDSKTAKGKVRARKGQHIHDGSDFITEFEAIK